MSSLTVSKTLASSQLGKKQFRITCTQFSNQSAANQVSIVCSILNFVVEFHLMNYFVIPYFNQSYMYFLCVLYFVHLFILFFVFLLDISCSVLLFCFILLYMTGSEKTAYFAQYFKIQLLVFKALKPCIFCRGTHC